MENSDFKLKNTHRVAALKLAIELINEQKVKPLYERRKQLHERIAFLAMQTLHDASSPFGGIEHLLDAGVCVQSKDLALGHFAQQMIGVAEINPSLGDNWHVLTDNSGRTLIRLVTKGPDHLTLPGDVVSFRTNGQTPSGTVVPVASLDWVLRHILARGVPSPLTQLVAETLDDVAPAILASFDQVSDIMKLISTCVSHSDLVRAFPAAAALFQSRKPEPVSGNTAALNLLHALS